MLRKVISLINKETAIQLQTLCLQNQLVHCYVLSVSLWDTHTHDTHIDTWLGYSHILIRNILGFSVCVCIGNMWYFLWGSYIINNTQHACISILNSNLIKNISLSIWQENESWRQFCMKNTALRIMRKVWAEIEFCLHMLFFIVFISVFGAIISTIIC